MGTVADMVRRGRGRALLLLAVATVLALPSAASAAPIEQTRIRAVFPGTTANPDHEWVELQALAAGQNELSGHVLTFYDPSGFMVDEVHLTDVANDQSQDTVLVASTDAGVSADITFTPNVNFGGSGGGVCLDAIDCVTWGSASTLIPSTPSPVGTPAGAIPDGSALVRTIARGCATLLDGADDSDDSAADFAAATAVAHNNSTAPTETACVSSGGGETPLPSTPPPSSIDGQPPQTSITSFKGDATKGTATIRFTATDNVAGPLSFRCKLDRKPFQACRSPKTFRHLGAGAHRIEVEAVDVAGNVDATPAKKSFRLPAR